ncbi:hypothetical protein BDY19DRAFT_893060 [Irpex rosettiformis]|uniref:Uncharacterized protein n=1 Tax=Irpex rosettiformis TaxID=378272 RepID=A0ACB8TZC7_9APHY|nr:hypothetical protein BDY19DRAFT_893060 [Irpex rosettiformis]
MFRLPTHLESFIPPPNLQVHHAGKPWRGILYIPLPQNHIQEVYCTAAETDGDNSQTDLWPAVFYVQHISQRPLLREVHEWVKTHTPPMCMFMPDRLPNNTASKANEDTFKQFADHLMQTQSVAFAPWNVPDKIQGAGIILFPTGTSRNLLVGALFLQTNFPEFILNANLLPRSLPYSPGSGHTPYDPAPPHIASSQRHYPPSASSSRYSA